MERVRGKLYALYFRFLFPFVVFVTIQSTAFVADDFLCQKTDLYCIYPTETLECFENLGFSLAGKPPEEIPSDFLMWLGDTNHQNLFLETLATLMKQKDGSLSIEFANILASIGSSLRSFSSIVEREQQRESFEPRQVTSIRFFDCTMQCSRAGCRCCAESDSLEEEITAMKEEAHQLKQEAGEKLLQAGGEAISAGIAASLGQPEIALIPGYQASKHLVEGCTIYDEAITLEEKIRQKEHELYEENYSIQKNESKKRWWELWK